MTGKQKKIFKALQTVINKYEDAAKKKNKNFKKSHLPLSSYFLPSCLFYIKAITMKDYIRQIIRIFTKFFFG